MEILHLEDCPNDFDLTLRLLKKSHPLLTSYRAETLEIFRRYLTEKSWDVILADFNLKGFTALEAIEEMQKVGKRIPFVLVSGAIGENAAVQAIQRGASDYVHKNDLYRLPLVINRAIETHQIQKSKEQALQDLTESENRLENLTHHLQLAIENERTSIAQEIHDDIGGSLAAVKLDLAWIMRHTQDTAILEHLDAAGEMLQQAMDASQRIMMNLRPAILDQGLNAAVQWLALNFEKRTSVKCQLQVPCTRLSLPKYMELAAFRTAQEALTNIAKHAKCTFVSIEVSITEKTLMLEITDNGQGISAEDRQKTKSFGLKGLFERAKTVGGWLDVVSNANVGTSIILSIPLNLKSTLEDGESL